MKLFPEVPYSEFGNRVRRACGSERVPLSGSFEITFKCNLRCVHCYVPDYSGRGEMTTAEITRILDETADEGCMWMLLTGGEVLCRSDFPEIYLHAKRLGLLITVFSNGTLLDERVADLLAEYPPFGVEFTLYGMSDETYLRTTGFPGRFTRVRRAIELLQERRVKLHLKAVAMAELADEIPLMQSFAEELGLPFKYDGMIHGRLDGSMAPTAARATPDRVVAFDADDPERLAEWMKFYGKFVKSAVPSEFLLSCGAGVQSFHVDPKGILFACEALPLNGYNLRKGSFREGWRGIVGDIRKRRAGAANVCASCELRALCDRCPASATLETGSPDGWIPYYCEVTHRRAALFEDALGNAETAARYRMHAEKVSAGWTPPGAILPRPGGAMARGAAGCSSGACGGCGEAEPRRGAPAPIQIDLPSRESAPLQEARR